MKRQASHNIEQKSIKQTKQKTTRDSLHIDDLPVDIVTEIGKWLIPPVSWRKNRDQLKNRHHLMNFVSPVWKIIN